MAKHPVEYYLAQIYPFNAVADDGEYVVMFPDLPGCLTQVERVEDIGAAAEEARTLWIETAYEQGLEIPLPTSADDFSGRFNVRIPRSLHRQLVQNAKREGISLNQYVTYLLTLSNAQHEAATNLDAVRQELARLRG
jgi:antitoxin HicB